MKRFTEASKWRDPWFRGLSLDSKLAFWYFVDNCDPAGVWEPDYEMVNFCLKREIKWERVWEEFGERIVKMPSGKLWMRKFIEFQYGALSESCGPHRSVIALCVKHGIDISNGKPTLTLPLPYPSTRVQDNTIQEKEEVQDKEKDQAVVRGTTREGDDNHGKTALQLRAERLLNRRATTPWDRACKTAWEKSKEAITETHEDEWVLLEWFYSIPPAGTYRRHDLPALLNNWTAEIDRARNFKANGGPGNTNTPTNGTNRFQRPAPTAEDHYRDGWK